MPKNPKIDPSGSLNVFYKPTTSKKIKGVPNRQNSKISEKTRTVPKKTKGGPFGLSSTFGNIKKLVVLCETRTLRSPSESLKLLKV